MKRTGNKNLKIMAATMMTIFSLASVFMGTFAWFITNRNVANNADSFNVDKTSSSINSITIHDFYGSTEDKKTFGFDPNKSKSIVFEEHIPSGSATFTMGKFSLDDPHHPVLLLFELSGGREDVVFSTINSYLTEIDLQQNSNPLSSVVETSYILFESDPTNSTEYGPLVLDKEVQPAKNYVPVTVAELSAPSSFVSFDANGEPVFSQKLTAFEGDTTDYTHLGIVIDYYSQSLEYIYSYFLGHTYLNAGLGFTCDWTLEL